MPSLPLTLLVILGRHSLGRRGRGGSGQEILKPSRFYKSVALDEMQPQVRREVGDIIVRPHSIILDWPWPLRYA